MDLVAQLGTQLADPFRIALLVGLVATAERTRAATGTLMPLLLGAAFVAVLIPLTTQAGATGGPPWLAMATGLAANLLLLAVIFGAWTLVRRLWR